MKVIDLLNKISNGEEIPNKIRIEHWCYKFEWVEHLDNYYDINADLDLMSVLSMSKEELNYEVKIIEEAFNVDGDDFDFLIGKSIKEVKYNTLICEDGTKITIEENEGCGGCGNGWSSLEDLKILEGNGVITNVESKYETNSNDKFKLFIYYHEKVNEIAREVNKLKKESDK